MLSIRSEPSDEVLDLSWEIFGELCRALALKVAREYDPELVVGVAKAGVIPGAVVASILQRDFWSLRVARRAGSATARERPAALSAAPAEARDKRVLVVDEITTSGDTMRLALAAVRDVAPAEVRAATNFVRPGGYQPDFFALSTSAKLVYPWNRKIFEGGKLVVNPRYHGLDG